MPRGKKLGENGENRSSDFGRELAPISSLASAKVTEDTQAALAGAGLSSFLGTEGEALALLAIASSEEEEYAPKCFQKKYSPARRLCEGCVFAASCWQGDKGYLRRLRLEEEPPPNHVPQSVIERVLRSVKRRVPPPKVRK